jgi:hypothetical protein
MPISHQEDFVIVKRQAVVGVVLAAAVLSGGCVGPFAPRVAPAPKIAAPAAGATETKPATKVVKQHSTPKAGKTASKQR